LALAAALFLANYRFKARAVTLPGEVIASSKPSQSRTTTSPAVRYVTPAGEQREYGYTAPLTGDEFLIGEKAKVLFMILKNVMA
jgi:hypothetical protein